MDTDDSYIHRQCAYEMYDRANLPCWGPTLTTEILSLEEGEFYMNTCTGHRLMLNGGLYQVEPGGENEFD
jgi:hypothetical protein